MPGRFADIRLRLVCGARPLYQYASEHCRTWARRGLVWVRVWVRISVAGPAPHRPVIPFGWRGEVWGRVGGGKCLGLVAKAPPSCGPAARAAHRKILVFSMNQLEQLAHDVRGFATEVRTLGYSSVAGGHENRFLELSERMMWQADQADGNKSLRRLTVPRNYP